MFSSLALRQIMKYFHVSKLQSLQPNYTLLLNVTFVKECEIYSTLFPKTAMSIDTLYCTFQTAEYI